MILLGNKKAFPFPFFHAAEMKAEHLNFKRYAIGFPIITYESRNAFKLV